MQQSWQQESQQVDQLPASSKPQQVNQTSNQTINMKQMLLQNQPDMESIQNSEDERQRQIKQQMQLDQSSPTMEIQSLSHLTNINA